MDAVCVRVGGAEVELSDSLLSVVVLCCIED